MNARLHIGDACLETDDLRVLSANVGTQGKIVWRWIVNIEVGGFKITKRNTRELATKQEALDDAEKNGVEIIYPGV